MKVFKNYSIMIPVLVFIIMALSMGLLIPDLGFYMDDWPNIFFQIAKGDDATLLFHAYDGRPLQGWYQIFLFNIFGTNAVLWQVYSLFLRYLTVITTWLIFRRLWPKSEVVVGLSALLFSVYPIFAQQQLAITFVVHWTSFFCVVLSIYLMLLSIDHPKWFLPFTLIGMGLSGVGLILIEYFIGLEFTRPVILWYALSKRIKESKPGLRKTVLYFVPYLLVVLGFIVWRVFFIDLPVADRNELTIFGDLISSPIKTVVGLIIMPIQDMITILVGSWYKTYQPEMLNLSGPVDILALGVTVLITGIVLWIFFKSYRDKNAQTLVEPLLWREQLITGLIMVLFGALPGWLIGRQVSDAGGLWNDRFAMASMAGAALVIVVLLHRFLLEPKTGLIILSVMLGLASGWQIRNANDYRWSWIYQERLYSQLLWRIPGLEPDTLFLADKEFFPKMGVYPTAFAINTLYPQTRDTDQVDYWFLTIPKYVGTNMEAFLAGELVYAGHWQASFTGFSQDSSVVEYQGGTPHYLWVLGPEDIHNPVISKTTRSVLSLSDLSRIQPEQAPTATVFSEQAARPASTWCYFYQKADLAQQLGDWEEIRNLWDQSLPYQSGAYEGIEMEPFIDGFLRLGDYQKASELTLKAKLNSKRYDSYLCSIWKNALAGQTLSELDLEIGRSIEGEISCDLF